MPGPGSFELASSVTGPPVDAAGALRPPCSARASGSSVGAMCMRCSRRCRAAGNHSIIVHVPDTSMPSVVTRTPSPIPSLSALGCV